MSVVWIHGNETAVHELYHIAYGVHRRHFHLHCSLLIVEEFHLVWAVHIVVDRVRVVGETLQQFLIARLSLGNSLNKPCNLLMFLVLPRVGVSPMVLEVTLHHLHLLYGSFLGIFLHTGVESGVDFQSAGIEVITIFLAPVVEIVCYCLAEILSLSVVTALHAVVEFYWYCLQ